MLARIYNKTIIFILYIIVTFLLLEILTIKIENNVSEQYVSLKETVVADETEHENSWEHLHVPTNVDTSFKSYMDYRTIKDRNSKQYHLQTLAYTDEEGFRRIDEYYLVAVGTFYSENCGSILEIGFSEGKVITAIVGDIKQDIHTNETNQYAEVVGDLVNIVEFIVDTEKISEKTLYMGDCSYSGMNGTVKYIKINNDNYLTKHQ